MIVANCVQSTGHDCLMYVITYLQEELNKAGIEWKPWIIDLHDELIFQVKKQDAEKAKVCVDKAVARLNLELGGVIPLKMEPSIVNNLADVKIEG